MINNFMVSYDNQLFHIILTIICNNKTPKLDDNLFWICITSYNIHNYD